MLTFHRLPFDQVDWELLDGYADRIVMQRRGWLEFVQAVTGGEIVIAQIEQDGQTAGFYSGILFRRCGVPILGSPFRGWTTAYMGFNLHPDVARLDALRGLERFAFRQLGCLHYEVIDRWLSAEGVAELGIPCRTVRGFQTDLTRSEDELFADMASACRRAIRKSEKSGITIEQAAPEGFAEEFYEHLQDVFAKQGMRPTFGIDRVRKLIRHVHPSGDLLIARVRDPEGRSIATGIYPGFRNFSLFWGNGSLRPYQQHRPNEALHWYAMRHFKGKGIPLHDWGGRATYKSKYGVSTFSVIAFRKSRFSVIQYARDVAEKIYYFPRHVRRARYKAAVNAH
ncbi:MAG TPA: GNAT family N-acetyltransferase [Geminicoccaceae bacterium]|nr:GNAT family N-acetyltransferase [Geminicoccaceae bacterium]